jgi:prepilin-type N-terminal cleavage/methylation domain-containing protein
MDKIHCHNDLKKNPRKSAKSVVKNISLTSVSSVAPKGFTLTEVMISILIVMILVTGAMGYQYASTRDVKISEVQASAARIGMLLLESWKGQQGDLSFDPVDVFDSEVTIQTSMIGPDVPNNSTGAPLVKLGSYEIILNNIHYYVTLSYDTESTLEPMILNATITWRRDYGQGDLAGDELFVRYSTFLVSY